MFQKSFEDVPREFQGCFKDVSRVFEENFKGVSRTFQESFKGVQGSFRCVSRKFFKKARNIGPSEHRTFGT